MSTGRQADLRIVARRPTMRKWPKFERFFAASGPDEVCVAKTGRREAGSGVAKCRG